MLGSLVLPRYLHGVHLQEPHAVQSQGGVLTASSRSIFSAIFARVPASGIMRISFSLIRLTSFLLKFSSNGTKLD